MIKSLSKSLNICVTAWDPEFCLSQNNLSKMLENLGLDLDCFEWIFKVSSFSYFHITITVHGIGLLFSNMFKLQTNV